MAAGCPKGGVTVMVTKRNIERRLKALEKTASSKNGKKRIEIYPDGLMCEPEPELTNAFSERGFVVEREQIGAGEHESVRLHTTPSAADILHMVSWHTAGPTAVPNDVRIVWEAERLEAVLADAAYPVEYADLEAPDNSFVIDDGDGWTAVVPADRVITNLVAQRGIGENHDLEILGPIKLPISGADEYDLVEVDADPDDDRFRWTPEIQDQEE